MVDPSPKSQSAYQQGRTNSPSANMEPKEVPFSRTQLEVRSHVEIGQDAISLSKTWFPPLLLKLAWFGYSWAAVPLWTTILQPSLISRNTPGLCPLNLDPPERTTQKARARTHTPQTNMSIKTASTPNLSAAVKQQSR